jgi:hypothetical protein
LKLSQSTGVSSQREESDQGAGKSIGEPDKSSGAGAAYRIWTLPPDIGFGEFEQVPDILRIVVWPKVINEMNVRTMLPVILA